MGQLISVLLRATADLAADEQVTTLSKCRNGRLHASKVTGAPISSNYRKVVSTGLSAHSGTNAHLNAPKASKQYSHGLKMRENT